MIFAVILAGENGARMGLTDVPKQFLAINNKPILITTVEKFVINPKFEKVIVLSPANWIEHTSDLIKKYILDTERVVVLQGGDSRNETIMNSIDYIESNYGLNDDTVILTHDSVRPFVTHRIIEDNLAAMMTSDACDTVIPATDTIVKSMDNDLIDDIPDRRFMFQGQTPQTFKAKILRNLYNTLSSEMKSILTDAAKIFVINGYKVKLVQGETYNIKITYPYDLRIAKSLLEDNKND